MLNPIIQSLFDCMEQTSDVKSKKDLATIIRREMDSEFARVGCGSVHVVSRREIDLVHDGRKLEAVKSYKNRTGKTLMESKHAVEQAAATALPRF